MLHLSHLFILRYWSASRWVSRNLLEDKTQWFEFVNESNFHWKSLDRGAAFWLVTAVYSSWILGSSLQAVSIPLGFISRKENSSRKLQACTSFPLLRAAGSGCWLLICIYRLLFPRWLNGSRRPKLSAWRFSDRALTFSSNCLVNWWDWWVNCWANCLSSSSSSLTVTMPKNSLWCQMISCY